MQALGGAGEEQWRGPVSSLNIRVEFSLASEWLVQFSLSSECLVTLIAC